MRLLERGEQTEQLTQVLQQARQRRGRIVLVGGPAGIGKTSLVHAFAQMATDEGATVRIGACDDLHAPRAFAPFRDFAARQSRLGQALHGDADRAEVLDAILEELDDPLRPIVYILEDLQWADDATLDAVLVAGRRIEHLAAALVITFRDDEIPANHPLRRVLGGVSNVAVERIRMAPLSRDAVAMLAGRSADAVGDLYAATGGNPFYVREMLTAPDDAVPSGIRDAVVRRMIALPEPTRRALEALSVIPSDAERWLLDTVVDARALDDAERAGIVIADARTIRFSHEIARRAVESELTTGTRVTLNAAVAAALAARDGDATRILHHAVEAGDSRLVLHHGSVAAREAARLGSHGAALRAYRQVYRFADGLAATQRAALALEYAYELQLGSRHADAVAVAAEAVRLLEDGGDTGALADALLVLSRAAYWHRGQAAAMPHAERAVRLVEGSEPSCEQAMAFAHMSRLHLLANRNEEATAWSERALDAAARAAHPPAEAGARITHGAAGVDLGRPDAFAELERGLELARRHGFDESVIRGYYHAVVALARQGRLDDAERMLADGLAYAADHQVAYATFRLRGLRGVFRLARGRLDEARAVLEDALVDEGEPGIAGVQPRAWLAQALGRMGEGDPESVAREAWRLAADSDEAPRVCAVAVARIELAWLAQRPDAARVVARPALTLADATRHAWYAGDLRVYLQRAGLTVDPQPAGVPLLEAHAAALRGDHAASASAWAAMGYGYEHAVELVYCDDADSMLDGVRRLDDMGAVATASLVRGLLRSRGVTSVPRGPTRRTRDNPAGLTDRQVDVLALLAGGMTNAEIADRLVLSVRTVDHHVSAILGKLDVATRQQAAVRAVELGLRPAVP
jgi:DNA-binding CsgD family transcriptional regulator/tetratricopeptide (TPR) repeat protein